MNPDLENLNEKIDESPFEELENFFKDAPETTATKRMPIGVQLGVLTLVLFAVFGVGTVVKFWPLFAPKQENVTIADVIHNRTTAKSESNSFENLSLSARSAFVWDVKNQKVLFEKAADEQLPLASITKLMTTLVANEIANAESAVIISTPAVLQEGDNGLSVGESFSLGKLTDLTLMSSSNDGAFAIATAAGALLNPDDPTKTFVEAMNIRAKELKLPQTYFRNPTGLDISETEAGAYGSARDIAFLMEYILQHKPDILARTTDESATFYNQAGLYHEAENTNLAINKIPGLIGSKTGYTDLSGGNLAITFNAGLDRPIIVVVLASTKNGRFKDILTLVNAAEKAAQQE